MGCLAHLERNFTSVGWFIPPYMQLGILSQIAAKIQVAGKQYTQRDLQGALARLYEPEGLAAIRCPCRARRHNRLKSWQKSIGHADFGCPGMQVSPQSWSARVRPHSQLQQHEPFPVIERAPLGADRRSHDRGACRAAALELEARLGSPHESATSCGPHRTVTTGT